MIDRLFHSVSRRQVLLIGAALTLAGGSLDEESLAGTIEALRGDAFAEGPKPRRALQPKAQVFIGDMVETAVNSALTMHLGKATFVKLGALAKFRIDNFVVDAGGTFDLDQGPMLIDHNGTKDENLQVRSPFGLMAVRGTMFFAGPSNDVFGVFVAPRPGGRHRRRAHRHSASRPRHQHSPTGRRTDRAATMVAGEDHGRVALGELVTTTERNPLPARNTLALRSHRVR